MTHNIIKLLREENDLSQKEVSSYLGISRPSYRNIENGEKSLTIEQAKTLAAFYNILVESFIHGKIERYELNIKSKVKVNTKKNQMRISIPQKKIDKFKQILLYILKKVGGKPNIGETVIYKLLYFIDFDYYEKYEEQIMGLTYIKNHHGPTPVEFKKVIEEMKTNGDIESIKSRYFKYEQKKIIAVKEPDLKHLENARELEHINEVLKRLSDKNASELTIYSHKDVPWITAEEGKKIEYESVFYRTDETSVREYED